MSNSELDLQTKEEWILGINLEFDSCPKYAHLFLWYKHWHCIIQPGLKFISLRCRRHTVYLESFHHTLWNWIHVLTRQAYRRRVSAFLKGSQKILLAQSFLWDALHTMSQFVRRFYWSWMDRGAKFNILNLHIHRHGLISWKPWPGSINDLVLPIRLRRRWIFWRTIFRKNILANDQMLNYISKFGMIRVIQKSSLHSKMRNVMEKNKRLRMFCRK